MLGRFHYRKEHDKDQMIIDIKYTSLFIIERHRKRFLRRGHSAGIFDF
jgi:hypothetical protein